MCELSGFFSSKKVWFSFADKIQHIFCLSRGYTQDPYLFFTQLQGLTCLFRLIIFTLFMMLEAHEDPFAFPSSWSFLVISVKQLLEENWDSVSLQTAFQLGFCMCGERYLISSSYLCDYIEALHAYCKREGLSKHVQHLKLSHLLNISNMILSQWFECSSWS